MTKDRFVKLACFTDTQGERLIHAEELDSSRRYWVIAVWDPDHGFYCTTWIGDDYTGYLFAETAGNDAATKLACVAFAEGWRSRRDN